MTTPPGPARKFGSRRWELAVASAGVLSRAEKAFLFGALPFLDWETGQTSASMQTIAAAAGYRLRAMQQAATRLEARGVVTFPSGRKGGLGRDRSGITNRMKVSLAALESLKGAATAPLRSASPSAKGRSPRPQGAQGTTGKGAPDAHNQRRTSTEESTTTTNGSNPGGGGASRRVDAGGEQEADPEPAVHRGHDANESARLLEEFGVSGTKARELGERFEPEFVKFGIAWVRKNETDNTNSPQGLLVSVFEDGTLTRLWQREKKRLAARAKELDQNRRRVLDEVFRLAQAPTDDASRAWIDERLAVIRKRWLTTAQLAKSGVVPDQLLFAMVLDPQAVIEAAFDAARDPVPPTEGARS